MRFPKELLTNHRKTYPNSKIHSWTYMYARHKPGHDWNPGEEFPDFSKIRSDQSFNWSAYSIPVWAKFNNSQEFKSEYGVVGYSVKTINNIYLYDEAFIGKNFGVKHYPEPNNYSHSELYSELSKSEKRRYRLLLKNNCNRKINPNTNPSIFENLWEYIIMLAHRMIVKVNNNR